MAENDDQVTDDSQKTEDPTPRRLEEARKRGQVVYSREVSSWLMLFTTTVLILMAAPGIMSDLRDTLQTFIEKAHSLPTDPVGLGQISKALLLRVAGDLALPFLLLIFVAVLSGLVQIGPLLTLEPLKPDLSKVSIVQGFSRLFSSRAVMEFLKGIVKLLIVSIAGVIVLLPYFDGIEHFVGQDFIAALFDLQSLFLKMMIAALTVLFIVAVADYLYQYRDFIHKMRMSKQELREEFKQTEGDPQIKARLRALREQKARQRMMQAVPEADVVITNPTHYAIALKYDTKEMDAPVVIAKGADLIALKIKEIANENKIPIVENAPLARALYDSIEIDQMITPEHFKAVAEVISYVFRLKGKKL